jgi:hypothetical protein
MGVGNSKLVKVMDVGKAEDDWCKEDDSRIRHLGKKEERY